MAGTNRTAGANGRLWGARAADWADIQEVVHGPIYEAVLDAAQVGSGTSFLDVGCGAGLTAHLAAERGAKAAGLDAAQALLEIAAARAPKTRFMHGDLEALPFGDGEFDVVSGINAFQYAGNPLAALSEARRVVGPSGKVAIVTWGEPEGMEAAKLVGAVKPLLPPPPPGAPGPFALSKEAALRGFAQDAGLRAVEVFDIDCPLVYPDMATAVRGMCSAGVAVKAMEAAGQDAVEEAYFQAFSEFEGADGRISVAASFRCLLAEPE